MKWCQERFRLGFGKRFFLQSMVGQGMGTAPRVPELQEFGQYSQARGLLGCLCRARGWSLILVDPFKSGYSVILYFM